MLPHLPFRAGLAAVVLLVASLLAAAEKKPADGPDLSDYRTVETAKTTTLNKDARPEPARQPAWLGVHADAIAGKLKAIDVDPESPAGKAGIKPGDVIVKVAGRPADDLSRLREAVASRVPGDELVLAVERDGKQTDVTVKLAAASAPLGQGGRRAILGVQIAPADKGVRIEQVTPDSPASKADIRPGDVIVKVDDKDVSGQTGLGELLSAHQPGDEVKLLLLRAEKEKTLSVKLGADAGDSGRPARWDDRSMGLFRKEVYRLAVIPVQYPDQKVSEKVGVKDWENALFSKGAYNEKSPTGQKVYGSLRDYYLEQSNGKLSVEGKVFEPVTVSKNRETYSNTANRTALLGEAVDELLKRDGKEALKDFDGIFFLYAGDRVRTQRGGLYWPHRATFRHNGKGWSYFICPEMAGDKMASISVIAHEFGHMLGLPDLYAQDQAAEGLGVWCTMSVGHGQDGKPLHFSAWCKEQLGWVKPALIDPADKQKLVLAAIEDDPKQCFKVLIRPDGSEYLLLENRTKKGFDRDLPAEGLLIWRVVDGRPVLEESHGVLGPSGPQRFLGSVPYPSSSNHSFTPATTPASTPRKAGGKAVHITNIRKLPDGRITFHIGYEYF